jgi:hypothetical protein
MSGRAGEIVVTRVSPLFAIDLHRRHTLRNVNQAGGARGDLPSVSGEDASAPPGADLSSPVAELPTEVYRDATTVIDSALRGDRDAVVGAFDAAVDRRGVRGAYDVAWCLAATLVGDATPGTFAALEFPGIDEARYDARWVARFVSAYANADTSTGVALFGAAMADGHLSECLLTLASSTVETLRRRDAGQP